MDQEALETIAPIVEEAVPAAEVVEEADKHEVEEVEAAQEPTITPKIPRKRAARPSPVVVPQPLPPIADHKFWSDMLATKRELDRETMRNRFANLGKF